MILSNHMNSLSLQWARLMVWYGPRLYSTGRGLVIGSVIMVAVWAAVDTTRSVFQSSLLHVRVIPQLTQQLSQGYSWSHEEFQPQNLQVSSVEVLSSGAGSGAVDAVAQLINPNTAWIAVARVHFTSDRTRSETQAVTVLPIKRQSVVAVGLPSSGSVQSVSTVVESIVWKLLPAQDQLFTLESTSIALASTRVDVIGNSTLVRLTIQNNTPRNYREARFLLRWYEGTRLVGMKTFSAQTLYSSEKRDVSLAVENAIASYARFELSPLFDITDPQEFFTPAASPRSALP